MTSESSDIWLLDKFSLFNDDSLYSVSGTLGKSLLDKSISVQYKMLQINIYLASE